MSYAKWIYNRLRDQGRLTEIAGNFVPRWEDLSEDDQSWWRHEARAYKRAARMSSAKRKAEEQVD